MTNELEDSPISLDDRLFNLLKEKTHFSFKEARECIPREQASDITIYKALNRLQATRRIRYVTTSNRKKYYTCIGVSNLPVFRTKQGEDLSLKALMRLISTPGFYQDSHWRGSAAIKDLPIELSRFFIIAQWEGIDLKNAWLDQVAKLREMQIELTTMLEYIETILKHPAMNGDLKKFKATFNGDDPDMPTMEEVNDFKRWLSQRIRSISTDEGTTSSGTN